jgi:hypothetical protein
MVCSALRAAGFELLDLPSAWKRIMNSAWTAGASGSGSPTAEFSHGICPECAKRFYSGFNAS